MMKKKKYIYAYDRTVKKIIRCKTERQAHLVADTESPEYIANCPKCDCRFGVN